MNTIKIMQSMHLALIRSGVTLVITVRYHDCVVSDIKGQHGAIFYRTLCGKSVIADDIQQIKYITGGVLHETAHS